MGNTEDRKSFNEIVPNDSATAQYDYEGGQTSKRIIIFAVRKFGLKKTEDPIFNLELKKPLSLSEAYEVLFKERWRRRKTIDNVMDVMQHALNQDEKEGYIKVSYSKQDTVSYCSFSLNEKKLVMTGRLRKEFLEEAIREDRGQEQEQKKKELKLTPEQIQEEKDKLLKKLGKSLGVKKEEENLK